jgi:glycerol uptake facilitator-like aquaporin
VSIDLVRRGAGELVGTALVVGAAVGGAKAATGIGAPPYLVLVIATLATAGAVLVTLFAIGPLSGGHVNPAVTASMVATGKMPVDEGAMYVFSQLIGGFIGALGATAVWPQQAVIGAGSGTLDAKAYGAEVIATCLLVGAVHAVVRGGNSSRLPVIVPAAVVTGSLTAPFGMANPAIALAAGLVSGDLGAASVVPLVVLEIAFASLVAIGVGVLYGNLDASAPTGPRAFEVRLDPGLDRQVRDHLVGAVRAAVRPQDVVVGDEQGCRIVLDQASDEVVDTVRRRIDTVIELSPIEHQLRDVDVELVPLAVAGRLAP